MHDLIQSSEQSFETRASHPCVRVTEVVCPGSRGRDVAALHRQQLCSVGSGTALHGQQLCSVGSGSPDWSGTLPHFGASLSEGTVRSMVGWQYLGVFFKAVCVFSTTLFTSF